MQTVLRLYKSTKRDLLILFSELDEMMTSLLRKQQIKTFKTFQQRISKMEKKRSTREKRFGSAVRSFWRVWFMVCLCLCYFVHPVRVRSGSERRFKSQRRTCLWTRQREPSRSAWTWWWWWWCHNFLLHNKRSWIWNRVNYWSLRIH